MKRNELMKKTKKELVTEILCMETELEQIPIDVLRLWPVTRELQEFARKEIIPILATLRHRYEVKRG